MNSHSAILYLLISAATSVRPEECDIYNEEFGWKGNNVKALNDCDILTTEGRKILLHLDTLVAKTQCVTTVTIFFEDSNKATSKRFGPYSNPGKEVKFGSLSHKCLKHDVRIKVPCRNCIETRIYETRFTLNPMKCYDMNRELNFTTNKENKTVLISNEYFHLSNNYVTRCMKSVSLINSNGTEIDAAWRKKYEVTVDRCKNETFTLVYTFASVHSSEEEKLKKAVEVPWDPENCLETGEENPMIFTSAIAAGSAFAIILVAISIVCYKRRKEIVKTDYNDIYGTYARGWDEEREYGDGDRVEMADHNPVYGI